MQQRSVNVASFPDFLLGESLGMRQGESLGMRLYVH